MNYAFSQIKFSSKLAKCSGPNNPHPLDWLYDSLSSPPVAGVWWAHTLDWLYDSLLSTCSWCVVSAYTWLALWLSLLSTCSWCVVSAYTWLALWLSLISTCSWCVVSAYTWLALWLSLISTCSWCVVSAYTWLALWLSLLSTCSWCVVSAYTWLALWLSLLSTCSWCVVSALAPLSCGSHCIIQVDAGGWGENPLPPHMIVKRFGIQQYTIKRYINASFNRSFFRVTVCNLFFLNRMELFAAWRDEDVIDPWVVTRFRCHTHTDTLAQFVVFDMVGSLVWAEAIMVRWHHTHNPQLSCWHTLHLHTRFRCAHTLHVRIHTPLCQD